MAPANAATIPAPANPAATPPAIHKPRCGTPRVAASTMPTISPASMTSRRTMMNAPSTPLLYLHHAARGFLVELADESVAADLERTEAHLGGGAAGHDLFDLQV